MKKEIFHEAMNQIDDHYLGEVLFPAHKTRLRKYAPIFIGAACICLVFAAAFLVRGSGKQKMDWPTKTIFVQDSPPMEEIYWIPHWEEMEIYQQYSSVEFSDRHYYVRAGVIEPEQLGNDLGTITAHGHDEYAEISGKDAERFHPATLREINGISPVCAVAVCYEGEDTFYAAVNSYYRPETLGQFIDDLNLNNTLPFGGVYYEFFKDSGEDTTVLFENVDSSKIWELLLSDENAVNEHSDFDFNQAKELLSISVDVPLLGYKNISIALYEDGYLTTNILDTGKKFYVGVENAQSFFHYVIDECEGYEIIIVYGEEADIPENEQEETNTTTATLTPAPVIIKP